MGFISYIKDTAIRFRTANNRTLATFFGCIAGFAVSLPLVFTDHISVSILGAPTTTAYRVLAVFLATGTGGNLSSYIGAGIDLLTNEKTIVDLVIYCLVSSGCMKQPDPPDGNNQNPEEVNRGNPGPNANPREGLAEGNRIGADQSGQLRPLADGLNTLSAELQTLLRNLEGSSGRAAPELAIEVVEPVQEFTTEMIHRKLLEVGGQIQRVSSYQAQQQENVRVLQGEKENLVQTLRDAQKRNGELTASLLQYRRPQVAEGENTLSPEPPSALMTLCRTNQ